MFDCGWGWDGGWGGVDCCEDNFRKSLSDWVAAAVASCCFGFGPGADDILGARSGRAGRAAAGLSALSSSSMNMSLFAVGGVRLDKKGES